MTLRHQFLLLSGVSLMVALGASQADAARRPWRCYQPFSWWRSAPTQQYYQSDAGSGTYRRYSFEPGEEAVPTPTAPTVTPAPAPSRTPSSAGDTVRRRLRPGSGN